MVSNTAMENMSLHNLATREFLKTIGSTERAEWFTKMDKCMKVTFQMEKKMDMESIDGKTVHHLKECMRKISNMERESSLILMGKFFRGNGVTGNDKGKG
jgi:hypothetical protein